MAWDRSTRKQRLPHDWALRRMRVLRRASFICEWRNAMGIRCSNRATDVDHIIHGDDHSEDNLQALCPDHHGVKSSAEGNAARKLKYGKRREPHPGYKNDEG